MVPIRAEGKEKVLNSTNSSGGEEAESWAQTVAPSPEQED